MEIELIRLPGETDDHIMIWLPEKKVLCCGDNYYACFPNLYAIRGGEYRNITSWINSLDVLRSYPAECLLPGHTEAVIGHEAIQETLKNYRDALDYLLTETLTAINQGKSPEQIAAQLRLPEEYVTLPYLGEFYGCVSGPYGRSTPPMWDGLTETPPTCTPLRRNSVGKRCWR